MTGNQQGSFLDNNSAGIPDAEIARIINENLPHWQAASDSPDADLVILQHRAFGSSPDELFLMSLAIKYAEIAHKKVTILP
jgi:hypothetical protein